MSVACPECRSALDETAGSPVSPYINVYACPSCPWAGLRCGNSSCDGYLEPEEMGYPNTVRYNCQTCGWTGTGSRLVPRPAKAATSPGPGRGGEAGGSAAAALLAIGVLVGLAVWGLHALRESIAQGEAPIIPFVLLAVPLLVAGVALALGVFRLVPQLRYGHDNARSTFALGLAVILGFGVYGLNGNIPVQRPDLAVTAAVGVACAGQAVALAGDAHTDGSEINHLVVLDAEGAESEWTGKAALDWRPPALAEVELVACVGKEQSGVSATCRYTGGSVTRLLSATRQIRVVAARSGVEFASFRITNRPSQVDCPFSKVGGDDDEQGNPVTWEQVAAHLDPLVREGRFIDPDGAVTLAPATTAPADRTADPDLVSPPPTVAPPTPPPAVELRAAVAAGSVAISGRGMNLEQLEITLESRIEQTMRVVINPATVLNPGSSATQSMVVISKEVVTLEAGEEVTLELEVACADMHRNTPDESDAFRLDTDRPSSALVKLFKVEGFTDLDFRLKQFAVWTITDNPSRSGYVGLGYYGVGSGPSTDELHEISDLFIEAGIDPDAYRAL